MPIFSLGERRVEMRGTHHYIAYNATLQSAKVTLTAAGYRIARGGKATAGRSIA